ncbi:MAG: sulfotransferase [Gracilimonas sp.]|nr:sulfotransferase [Gracilimonas sp.]
MYDDLKSLNKKRTEVYQKPEQEESFLQQLNDNLEGKEKAEYATVDIEYPIIFVIGLPRSGTTLLSQILAHGLDLGYINNITARFWAAPLHGLKLSDILIGNSSVPEFHSEYGATQDLSNIHEFGYFWRKWLKKNSFTGITNAKELESEIDWDGLKRVLANLQYYRQKAFIFKNIFGTHHIQKLDNVLKKTLWIYIERDILDVAISNLNARKKFYDDPSIWWSSAPPEFEELKKLDTFPQIAGQLHYLKKFYRTKMNRLQKNGNSLVISYEELCNHPAAVLNSARDMLKKLYGFDIPFRKVVPDTFPLSRYNSVEETQMKEKFELHFKKLQQNDPIPKLK